MATSTMTTYFTNYGYIQIDKNELVSSSPVVAFNSTSITGSINVNSYFI
jgi:hypothetical protein